MPASAAQPPTLCTTVEPAKSQKPLVASHPPLAQLDLAALVERAREQRERVEAYRRAMARRAFTGD